MKSRKLNTAIFDPLTSLSPIDGRYRTQTQPLIEYFSEYALIRHRHHVELAWFEYLCQLDEIPELPSLSAKDRALLQDLRNHFSLEDAQQIKQIEKTTQHDMKAIEYYLQRQFERHPSLKPYISFLHFACTSEDISNVAYALILKEAENEVLIPAIQNLMQTLSRFAIQYAHVPMLARTHGQPASPTTVGKEFANFAARLQHQIHDLKSKPLTAKFNGTVGNYHAHHIAYPHIDWPACNQAFIESLGLAFNPYSTQIEPHDTLSQHCHHLAHINRILIGLSQDLWGYIAFDYFKQRKVESEVGSSTMPHKINPIDFENAEGNLSVANALLQFFQEKLSRSRWQRDLSDSTVQRNLGVACAHSLLAYESLSKGLSKIEINRPRLEADLNEQWNLLAEPIQTILRQHGDATAYEKLKQLSRGVALNAENVQSLISELDLPLSCKEKLLKLTPDRYLGLAPQLAEEIEIHMQQMA